MLRLRGGRALSPFRLEKLIKEINLQHSQVSHIYAEYWHFCALKQPLQDAEQAVLERLLDYAPVEQTTQPEDAFFLVLPRPGTISPWSSKATDIAHHCGLEAIERIERGIVFHVGMPMDQTFSDGDRASLLHLLHDRMTEMVFESFDDAEKLFQHYPPLPLNTVDVVNGGIAELEKANQEMGLALSVDEIEYLAHNFKQIARNPTDVELMMFAQANSEHCRHKIFNADWVIDGQQQDKSLFAMIRNTHQIHPQGTIVAYSDNSSVIEGAKIKRFYPSIGNTYG
ncbi:MAG: phosphoribosylformylglycinamidine synthase, partial [Nitrosomonas sp.]|nr:phosphoribosylformylglycinamidine synthase [Nitrosomonas sp.]